MSEERTEDIAQKYNTQPTIQTVLERLDEFRATVETRFDGVERRFDDLHIRLDRIESVGHDTQSKFHSLRADFNELKIALREQFPTAVK
jgi:hypothetical protein